MPRARSPHRSLHLAPGDEGGGVAVMFAVALVPLIFAVGGMLDYTRANAERSALTAAADGAALSAARVKDSGMDVARRVAENHLAAALQGRQVQVTAVRVLDVKGAVRVEVEGDVRNAMLSAVGRAKTRVGVAAEASTAVGGTSAELSLVLDVTGSMAQDMVALRDAARAFVDTVMASGGSGGAVKVAVVPFVAAVNPPKSVLMPTDIDAEAKSKWHAAVFLRGPYGSIANCSGGGYGTSLPPFPSPGTGKTEGALRDALRGFAEAGRELFGVTPAQADVTPPTTPPTGGRWIYPGAPWADPSTTAYVPTSWNWSGDWSGGDRCVLYVPPTISHLDLFKRIPGARWKGCVEARVEPYDVTDQPPSVSNPDSLFVPYFYPDEPGPGTDPSKPVAVHGLTFRNDYLPDARYAPDGTAMPAGNHDVAPIQGWAWWGDPTFAPWVRMRYLLKYDGRTAPPSILGLKETGPDSYGPNRACPDEMLAPTTDKAAVQAKVASLSHWNGGGTIGSEGVACGWRALSPEAPFRAMPYKAENKKYLVLMTDGLNQLSKNGVDASDNAHSDKAPATEYTAYGYLNGSDADPSTLRFPTLTFDGSVDYLNQRMKLVCANAKAKGIVIYTILFRETDPRAVDTVKACATESKFFFHAVSQPELKNAFVSIGSSITALRLTR